MRFGTIEDFCATEGLNLRDTYVEVETGKGADALDRRPQLAAALGPRTGLGHRNIQHTVRYTELSPGNLELLEMTEFIWLRG